MPGTYSIITRASGSLLTAAIYMEDHQAHLTYNTPGGCDDYSTNVAQMQSVVDPGEVGTESQPTDLAGEIQRLRNIIKEITGKTHWYESPTALMYTTMATQQSLGSGGTSKDFVSIPVGTRRITIMIVDQSTNGTSNFIVQLGDAGGVETTGYEGTISSVFNVNTTTCEAISSAGFTYANSIAAAGIYLGKIVLDLEDASSNRWMCSSTFCRRTTAPVIFNTAGYKALSATLDRVRITMVNGTDTYDGGTVMIKYE